MRILFTSTPGRGHIHPLLPFVRAALAAGDDVLFGVGPAGLPVVARYDLDTAVMAEPSAGALGAVLARVPDREPDTYFVSEVFGRLRTRTALAGTIATVERFRPDLVVSECFELTGAIAAEAAGVPHVTVGVRPLDTRDLSVEPLVAVLDAIRTDLGLPRAGVPPWEHRTRFVTAVVPQLWNDFASAPAGTLLVRHEDAEGPVPSGYRPRSGRARVYATLGSAVGALRIGASAFPAVLAGLGAADADVLLATVAYHPARFPSVPTNVRVEREAPFHAAMVCDAVVHHGGCGTTLAALSRGLPAVTVPLVSDGPHIAARLEAIGAGRTVTLADAPRALPAAIRRVLVEPSYVDSATRVAAEIAGYPTAAEVLPGLHRSPSGSLPGFESRTAR
jgi:UDP:flavonoid glycosyltransferase YjiC (YdhE family)